MKQKCSDPGQLIDIKIDESMRVKIVGFKHLEIKIDV